jgi:hypothetical protein
VPSKTEALEGFKIDFHGGELLGRFQRVSSRIVSSLDADMAYRSIAHAEAQPTPPPATEDEDDFPLPILTLAIWQITTFTVEVFSIILCPEDCGFNFLLCFMGLANALVSAHKTPISCTNISSECMK